MIVTSADRDTERLPGEPGLTDETAPSSRRQGTSWPTTQLWSDRQYRTEIDGLHIHFLHGRSRHVVPVANARLARIGPQFSKVIGPLTAPTAHGKASDAFRVSSPRCPDLDFRTSRKLRGRSRERPWPSQGRCSEVFAEIFPWSSQIRLDSHSWEDGIQETVGIIGGGRRTRTFEVIRRLIYSQLPLPLGTLPRSTASEPPAETAAKQPQMTLKP